METKNKLMELFVKIMGKNDIPQKECTTREDIVIETKNKLIGLFLKIMRHTGIALLALRSCH